MFVVALFGIYWSITDVEDKGSSKAEALSAVQFALGQAIIGAQYLSFSFSFFTSVHLPDWTLNLRSFFSFLDFSVEVAGPECFVRWTPVIRWSALALPCGELAVSQSVSPAMLLGSWRTMRCSCCSGVVSARGVGPR